MLEVWGRSIHCWTILERAKIIIEIYDSEKYFYEMSKHNEHLIAKGKRFVDFKKKKNVQDVIGGLIKMSLVDVKRVVKSVVVTYQRQSFKFSDCRLTDYSEIP